MNDTTTTMNNSDSSSNGSTAAAETMEEFRLRKDLANFIRYEVDRNAFKNWKSIGCQIVTRGEVSTNKTPLWVLLNGLSEEENSHRRDQILDVLKKAEVQWMAKDPDARIDEKGMKVALRMLIPSHKAGFVIGKHRERLNKIEGDNEVRAFIDNGKKADDGPIPAGFARLVLISTKIEGIRAARAEIAYLIKQCSEENERQPWVDLEMLVPCPTYREVIGVEGETIKKIAKEFGVTLAFMGDNAKEYPDGRRLRITGPTEGRVEQVREHIQKNFVDRPHPYPHYNHHHHQPLQPIQKRHQPPSEYWNQKVQQQQPEEFQKEIPVPETVSGQMIKIRNKYDLFGYEFPRKIRSDGRKTVLLKGTRQAVEEAAAELVRMANEEMAKNEKAKEVKKMKSKLAEFDQSGNEENLKVNETNFVYSSDEGEKKRKNVTFKHPKENSENGTNEGMPWYDTEDEGLSMDPDFIGEKIQMEEKPINVQNYEEEDEDDDEETTYDNEEENSNVDYVDAEEMNNNGNGGEEMDGTIGDAEDSNTTTDGSISGEQLMASLQTYVQQRQMEKKELQKSQMENRKLQALLNVAEKQKAGMKNHIRALQKRLLDTERRELALQWASRVGSRKCDDKQKH